jgi:uncharacterized protein (TIGR02302 family)
MSVGPHPNLSRRLGRYRARLIRIAWVGAFGPALALALGFAGFSLVGVLDQLSGLALGGIVLAFWLGFAVLLWRGFRRYRPPGRDAALSRFEAGFETRPFSALTDQPSGHDRVGQALWQAHLARAEAQADRLPDPSLVSDWAKVDPYLLRFSLPVLVLALGLLSGPLASARLHAGLFPDLARVIAPGAVKAQAWIVPPDHLGSAPIFLSETATEAVSVPVGSRLTLRVQAPGTPRLRFASENGSGLERRLTRTADGAYESSVTLSTSGTLKLDWFGTRARWPIEIVADAAPTITLDQAPSRGKGDAISVGWSARDDNGLSAVDLIIIRALDGRGPLEDVIPLPLGAAGARTAADLTELDLTRHRWAGLDVTLVVRAVDGAGQTGQTQPTPLRLPERAFLQPLAAALSEVRADILRDPDGYASQNFYTPIQDAGAGIQQAARKLDALLWEPDAFNPDMTVHLAMSHALHLLYSARDTSDAEQAAPVLWEAAVRLEFGDLADEEAALLEARRRLEQALRDGDSEDEIKRRLEDFREAAQNYLAAKMAQALALGETVDDTLSPLGPNMSGNDLTAMFDALEDLAETGATEQARQLLNDMTAFMQSLEFQQGAQGEGEGEPTEDERAIQSRLAELLEAMGIQRQLSEETFDRQREQEAGQTGSGPSAQSGSAGEPDLDALADAQSDLAQTLRQAEDSLVGMGEDGERAAEALARARAAQEQAAAALREGDTQAAQQAQQEAGRAMREASRELAEGLDTRRAERQGNGQPGGQANGQPGGRDPLGRPTGGTGSDGGEGVSVPDQAERDRARDVLDELRRREGEANRTREERNYLERLLDRF